MITFLCSKVLYFFTDTDLHNVIKKGNILKDIHKRYIMYQVVIFALCREHVFYWKNKNITYTKPTTQNSQEDNLFVWYIQDLVWCIPELSYKHVTD